MRTFLICALMLVVGAEVVLAQAASPLPFRVTGLVNSYSVNGEIRFALVNIARAKISYGIVVEELVDNRWVEKIPNIEDETYRPEFELREISVNQRKEFVWRPHKGSLPIAIAPGLYRFCIFFHAPGGKFERAFSDAFRLR